MARRTATFTVNSPGRDLGKRFHLEEQPIMAIEEWCRRGMAVLLRSGVEIPPGILDQGPSGFVALGVGTLLSGLGKAPTEEVSWLFQAMLKSVTGYQEREGAPVMTNMEIILGQIEELRTMVELREQIASVHLGWSLADHLSRYRGLVTDLLRSNEPAEPLDAAAE